MTKRQRAEAVYRIKPLKWWVSISGSACDSIIGTFDIVEEDKSFNLTYPAGWQSFRSMDGAKDFADRWYRRQLTKALTKVKAFKVTGKGE